MTAAVLYGKEDLKIERVPIPRVEKGEVLIFLSILFVGLIYVWVKHDLEWVKNVPE